MRETMSFRSSLAVLSILLLIISLPSVIAAPSPEGLQATPGAGYVDLSWQPAEDADAYLLYRGSAEDMVAIANLTAPFTAYHDDGLEGGSSYLYYVTAVQGGNESAPGNAVSVTVLSEEKASIVLPVLAIVLSIIAVQACIVMLLYFSKLKMQLK